MIVDELEAANVLHLKASTKPALSLKLVFNIQLLAAGD